MPVIATPLAPSNGLELRRPTLLVGSCPAEAGNSPLLYSTPAGQANSNQGPARRVGFSELLGGIGAKCPGMEVLCKVHIDGRITETAIVGPGVTS